MSPRSPVALSTSLLVMLLSALSSLVMILWVHCKLLHYARYRTKPVTDRYRGDKPEELTNDLLDCFKTNVIGNIHLFNLYLPLVLKGRAKKVIAISSGMADDSLITKYNVDLAGPYSISKAALNTAVAKFAAQYEKEGVLFLSLSPGVVATEMNTRKSNSLQCRDAYAYS